MQENLVPLLSALGIVLGIVYLVLRRRRNRNRS